MVLKDVWGVYDCKEKEIVSVHPFHMFAERAKYDLYAAGQSEDFKIERWIEGTLEECLEMWAQDLIQKHRQTDPYFREVEE